MHRGASLLIGVVPLRSLLADKDRTGWFIIYQYLCVLVKGMSFWDRTPKHSVRADTAALVHTHLPPPPTLYSSPSPSLPSPPTPLRHWTCLHISVAGYISQQMDFCGHRHGCRVSGICSQECVQEWHGGQNQRWGSQCACTRLHT